MDQNTLRPLVDASTLRCESMQVDCGAQVKLPNGATFVINDAYFPVDWRPQYDNDNATTKLWHRSLAYLPSLLKIDSGWKIVERILHDFLAFMKAGITSPRTVKMASFDHALAIQIRVCNELDARNRIKNEVNSQIAELIDELRLVLLEFAREPGLRLKNNHGIMLSLALMQTAVLAPEIVSDSDAVEDARIAIDQLSDIIDDSGLTYENTPSYQGLYVRLLKQFMEAANNSSRLGSVAADFAGAYEIASNAYRRQLLPSGKVPPLGDGGVGIEPDLEPLLGKLISTPNGLYVSSNQLSYLSVICGARSPIHKQMDDTSILMEHAGRLLVLDAGVQDYDSANARGASIRTQRGHSGLYFAQFDDKPLSFFNPESGVRRVDATMTVASSDGIDTISCEYKLDEYKVNRLITTASPDCLTVSDCCWSPDGASAVARFLLPAQLEFVPSEGALRASDDTHFVLFEHDSSSTYLIKDSYISWNLRNQEKCRVVEFPVRPGGLMSTIRISVGTFG